MTLRLPPCPSSLFSRMTPQRLSRRRRSRRRPLHIVGRLTPPLPLRRLPITHTLLLLQPPHPPLPLKGARLMGLGVPKDHIRALRPLQLRRNRKNAEG